MVKQEKTYTYISIFAAFILHFILFLLLFYRGFGKVEGSVIMTPRLLIVDSTKQISVGRKNVNSTKKEKGVLTKDVTQVKSGEVGNSPIYNPLPQIPDELRHEAFQSEAEARFYIAASGEVTNVELLKPCTNPKLNYLLLKALRNWKFAPRDSSSTKDVKIKFKVE